MLRRVLLTFFVIIAIAGGVVGYLYYQRLKVPVSASINAVPENAAIIIQANNLQAAWKKIKESSILWKDLCTAEYFKNINNKINWLDSVGQNSSSLADALEKSPLLISVHPLDSGKTNVLFALSVPSGMDEPALDELVKENAGNDAYFSQRIFEGAFLYEAKKRNTNGIFAYALKKGVFIASFDPTLVEKAITHLNSNKSILSNPAFNKVYSTVGNSAEANVFINNRQFTGLFANSFTEKNSSPVLKGISSFAQFGAYDLKIKPNSVNLTGFNITSDSARNWTALFNDQQAQRITVTKVLPVNIAGFIYKSFSNYRAYAKKLEEFAKKQYYSEEWNNLTENLEEKSGAQLSSTFGSWIGAEAAVGFLDPEGNNLEDVAFAAVKSNNPERALQVLTGLAKKTYVDRDEEEEEENPEENEKKKDKKKDKKKEKKKENNSEDDTEKASTDSDNAEEEVNIDTLPKPTFDIYHLTFDGGLETQLGREFNIISKNYFVKIEDFFFFANNEKTLKEITKYYKNNRTLANSESYRAFSENLSNDASIMLYTNVARSASLLKMVLEPSWLAEIGMHEELIRKFEGFAIQLSYKKDLLYSNIHLKHNPEFKKETNSLWEVELDAPISIRPKIVTNHLNDNKEIMVQDENNTVYLINNKGEVEWKTEIKEKIESDITQIDRFKNNKLQYVFNTRNYIYMMDRNGKNCEGFPVKLKSPATNSLSVFDYENNRDYRLLIACDNNRVYNYNPDGENVMGWEFTLMKNRITKPVQHFVISEKDYILAIDIKGEIRLVDRKGKSILEFTEKVPIGRNSEYFIEKGKELSSTTLVTTDSLGNILKFKFNDRLEIIKIKTFTAMHYFEYKDLDDDNKKEYIFADNNELFVYDQDKALVLTSKFAKPISQKPLFFLFPDGNGKIGIVCRQSSEIYLLNNKGAIEKGFPKYGTTPFSISDINQDKVFNVVVGGSDKFLYTYSLED